MTDFDAESKQAMRQRAEEKIKAIAAATPTALSLDEAKVLLHELQVHQIELQMQNEELQRSQVALAASRERYLDLYGFAPVGYLTINDKNLISETNLACAKMLGVERKNLINTPLSSFISKENQDVFYRSRKLLFETEQNQTCELRMKNREGHQFSVQMQTALLSDIGRPAGQFQAVLIDISEGKAFEESLRRSKEEWAATFDAMSDIVTILNTNMHIVRANKAAHDFFQVQYGELNGKNCHEVFTGISAPCPGCPLVETLKDRKEHSAIITHENLGKTFHVSSAVVPDENGDIQHIVYVAKDITEQKKMEDELFQASKMEAMGTLAGGIAHDFNNILAAILGFSEFAKCDLPEDSKARQDIEHVISAGQRASELVKQILTFSHKADQLQHPFQPHLIIKEAMKMLRSTLPTTIAIEEHIDPECGSILANPTNIHQIVVNICTNAYHAMENEKGALTVTLSRTELRKEDNVESDVSPGPFVELSIQDTGQGMDKKTMSRIFEPYFTTKGVSKGSGLGLAVVYGIVKSLQGFIRVESEPGKGSTFHVYIPASKEVAATSVTIKQKDIPGGTERILVVDDESMIVNLNTTILERLGYTVTATTSSVEALEKVRAHVDDFDLIITDQTMPNLSGLELAQEIIKINRDMPIILCSGYSSVIKGEGALTMGIKKYAMKPVGATTLAQIVREVLDKN